MSALKRAMPPWLEESEGDAEDDDWFYDSIRRYEQLCMYNLSCLVQGMDVSPDGSRICLSGVLKGTTGDTGASVTRTEILVFSLPQKLLVDCPIQEGLLHKRDFSLVAGGETGKVAADDSGASGGVKQVLFLDSTRVLLLAGNALSLWGIKEDTDLMVNVKHQELGEGVSAAVRLRLLQGCIFVFGNANIWKLESEGLDILAAVEQEAVVDVALHESGALVLAHSDGSVSFRDFNTLNLQKRGNVLVTDDGGEKTVLGALSGGGVDHRSLLVAFCCPSSGRLSVSKLDDDKDVLEVTDELLLTCTDLVWTEGPQESLLMATCGDKVGVFSQDEKSLKRRFCHDGHRSAVTGCIGHRAVQRLFFSTDAAGSIHAWLYEKHRVEN